MLWFCYKLTFFVELINEFNDRIRELVMNDICILNKLNNNQYFLCICACIGIYNRSINSDSQLADYSYT